MAVPSARYERHRYVAQAVFDIVDSYPRPFRLDSTNLRNVARQVGPLVDRDYAR